jgi:hypothetical protein
MPVVPAFISSNGDPGVLTLQPNETCRLAWSLARDDCSAISRRASHWRLRSAELNTTRPTASNGPIRHILAGMFVALTGWTNLDARNGFARSVYTESKRVIPETRCALSEEGAVGRISQCYAMLRAKSLLSFDRIVECAHPCGSHLDPSAVQSRDAPKLLNLPEIRGLLLTPRRIV